MIEKIDAFVADIDMTLTAKGDPLPDVVKEALQILHDNGILLGLATGREIDQRLLNQARDWGLDYEFDFLIGMNGGMVYDTASKHLWSVDFMTVDEMKEVLYCMMPLIEKYEIAINAEGGGNHNAMYINDELMRSMKRHGFNFIDKTGDVEGFCEKPTYKFLFRTTPDVEKMIRERYEEKLSDHYQIVGTFPGTVEIMHKGIDKGTGLKHYAQDHNLNLDNIIAFGDNENDNSLLEVCGWGVALKNSAPQTMEIADDITDYECKDGGVGHYLMDRYIIPKGLK